MYNFMKQFDMSMFSLPGPKTGEKMEREFFPAQNCNFDTLGEKDGKIRVRWTNRTGEISPDAISDPILLKYIWNGERYICTGKVYPAKKSTQSEPAE